MMVNALLLFQIFHFFVAYVILKYLLLRPGLAVMKQLDREKLLLKSNVALLSEEAARREAVVEAQWKRHCQVLYLRYAKSREDAEKKLSFCVVPAEDFSFTSVELGQLEASLAEDVLERLSSERAADDFC